MDERRIEKPVNPSTGREKLLAATVRIVAEAGLRGMTYRAVADAAGVNNTLISYHFGTRNALLIAAMDWAVQRTASWTSAAGAVTDPGAFTEDLARMILDDPELQIFQYEMLLESRRIPEIRESVVDLYERYIDQIADALLERGYSRARERARVVFAALDGLILQNLATANHATLRESLSLLGTTVLTNAADS